MLATYGAPNKHERRLMLRLLHNAAARLRPEQAEARDLAEWLHEWGAQLLELGDQPIPGHAGSELTGERWQRIQEALGAAHSALGRARPDTPARRLNRLGRALALSGEDTAILELLVRYHTRAPFQSMLDAVFRSRRKRLDSPVLAAGLPTVAEVLSLSTTACATRLQPGAPLFDTGLVWPEPHDSELTVLDRLDRLVHAVPGQGLDPQQILFDTAPPGDLEWFDFEHIAADRDYVEDLLRGALTSRERGVNVLLYGPPGGGKTEFCRTLARHLGVNLLAIGESDDGDEPRRSDRLRELKLAQNLCARGDNAVLLFDEMEDLLSGDDTTRWSPRGELRPGGSKVFLNRLLEETPTPILWTTNAAESTPAAILRRMLFALELPRPGPRVRARVWARHLSRHGVRLAEEDARSLATEYATTPAIAAAAVRAARLAGRRDVDTLRQGVGSLARLLDGQRPPSSVPLRFDLDLVRADTDLALLAARLATRGKQRCSLCLQGPPGTGKSAYVRHLAERAGLEVAQKRASDLMSMWVGGTEQQIAAAFQDARAQEQFLVFDEADSLLSDRRLAQRSWEVSQVNEMLTWMESHPLPFACTTNYGQRLDPATLRRFDFKIAFEFLGPAQVEAAFRSYFGLEPPRGLADTHGLTPGDFAVVRRKAEVLDRLEDADALAAMLRLERDAKPDLRNPIGFLR